MNEHTTAEIQTQVEVPVASIDSLKLTLENEGLDGISRLLVGKGFNSETVKAYLTTDPKSRELKFGTPSEATPENFLARLTTDAEKNTKKARQELDAAIKARIEYNPIKDTRTPTQMEENEENSRNWYEVRYREYARLLRLGEQHKKGDDLPLRDEIELYQKFALADLSMTVDSLDKGITLPSLLKPEQVKDIQLSPNPPGEYSLQQKYAARDAARALDLVTNYMTLKRVTS